MEKRKVIVLCIVLMICIAVLMPVSVGCGCSIPTAATKNISFVVQDADAKSGEKGISVTVSVMNNPGFSSARLEIGYDDSLTLTGFSYNTSKLDGAAFVPYNAQNNPPSLSVTSTDGDITGDFELATLYFDVCEKAEDSCEVTLSCKDGDVYDAGENNLKCDFVAGKISISDAEGSADAVSDNKADTASDSGSNGTHTVVFKDESGKVISTQTVKDGEAAPEPTAPEKEGYVFKGWSEPVDKITSDKTLTPVYEELGFAPQFVVGKAQAKPGERDVEVTVSLKNNTGIASLLLDILYDTDNLKLTGFEYNKELTNGSSTVPFNEKASPPCLSMVNGTANITGDGVLATLYFEVSDSAEGGYPVVVSYDKNNVYNIDEENVMFETVNGLIEIK